MECILLKENLFFEVLLIKIIVSIDSYLKLAFIVSQLDTKFYHNHQTKDSIMIWLTLDKSINIL